MSTRRKSSSLEDLPSEKTLDNDLKVSSLDSLPNFLPETTENSLEQIPDRSDQNDNSLRADDVQPSDRGSRRESYSTALVNALTDRSIQVEHGFSLPCTSCEFFEPEELVEVSYCWGCCKKRKSWSKIVEYWIISVPKEENIWENLNAATKNVSQNYKFHTPILKVGVLDKLMEYIEQLKTLDKFVKEVLQGLIKMLKVELGNNRNLLEENLKVYDMSPATYLTRFNWNRSKYPTWQKISVISDQIYSYIDNINECLKKKFNRLEQINADIKPYEGRGTDNLRVRYLGDIVKKEHFIQDSNFLTTLLVVVPNKKREEWEAMYTSLSDMVVPHSSTEIFNDDTDTLYTVILPSKDVEQFKENGRTHHFIVRDYEYSEKKHVDQKSHYENLERAKAKFKAEVLRWTKVMFGETFEAWIHVKTLRVFVESVVRFGLPVNYQAFLILPMKSKHMLRRKLQKLYKNVEPVMAGNIENTPGGLASYYGVSEYYPYVYFDINLGFLYK